MTVAQLVSLFETIDRRAQAEQNNYRSSSNHQRTEPEPVTTFSKSPGMPSQKMKLSLHTMFGNNRTRSRPRHAGSPKSYGPLRAVAAYPLVVRPQTPTGLLSPMGSTASASTSTTTSPSSSLRSHYAIRRHPSAVDLALEEERCAVGVENIGLSMLEPRPRATSGPRPSDGHHTLEQSRAYVQTECSLMEFMHESRRNVEVAPLDGIFEVMERGR